MSEILEIDYNSKLRDILFGNVSKKMLEGYVNFIKNIPHGAVPEATKKNIKIVKTECKQNLI